MSSAKNKKYACVHIPLSFSLSALQEPRQPEVFQGPEMATEYFIGHFQTEQPCIQNLVVTERYRLAHASGWQSCLKSMSTKSDSLHKASTPLKAGRVQGHWGRKLRTLRTVIAAGKKERLKSSVY